MAEDKRYGHKDQTLPDRGSMASRALIRSRESVWICYALPPMRDFGGTVHLALDQRRQKGTMKAVPSGFSTPLQRNSLTTIQHPCRNTPASTSWQQSRLHARDEDSLSHITPTTDNAKMVRDVK